MYSSRDGAASNPFAGRQMPGSPATRRVPRPRPAPSGNAEDLEGGGSRAMAVQQGYHSSRAEAVQSVQKTIGELAQMFQKRLGLEMELN